MKGNGHSDEDGDGSPARLSHMSCCFWGASNFPSFPVIRGIGGARAVHLFLFLSGGALIGALGDLHPLLPSHTSVISGELT